ncbi:MAG: GTP-binding protein [Candidatus Thorarchaeota archaeon]|nr:GTP-binding protein [Candidatus Thorarchaeota archaeon]
MFGQTSSGFPPLSSTVTGEIPVIINTYLIRASSGIIIAKTKYWPIETEDRKLQEFLSTRDEIKSASGEEFKELPLILDDDKFLATDVLGDLLLVYVTDIREDERSTADRLRNGAAALKKHIAEKGLETTIDDFSSIIEPSITTKLKIALVGEGGVGKTTTLHLLLGDTPPTQYVPTIALNLETVENIRFGNYSLVLWDFAGQERFRKLWRFYFHGADVIFLVCDSSLRNVIISKDILKLIRRDAPKVPVFAIANKQDKPNVMTPEVVQKILGVPTYSMVAVDKGRRDEMLRILMDAAAHYVGVTLPDLPATQLLRFADEATEIAIAEVDARAKRIEEEEAALELETIEVVEEVFVDEDGHVIESTDEYEIVEEVVEEVEDIFSDSDFAEALDSVDSLESETEDFSSEPEAIVSAVEETPLVESLEEAPAFQLEVESENEPVELDSSVVMAFEEPSEQIAEANEVEQIPSPADTTMPEGAEPVEEYAESEEPTEEVETPVDETDYIPVPAPSSVLEENGTKMALDLIIEALEADEMVSAAIEEVPKEDIGTALEAFSSHEVLPLEDESDSTSSIDEETKRELTLALGESEADTEEPSPEEADEATRDLDAETILELDAILNRKSKDLDSDSKE